MKRPATTRPIPHASPLPLCTLAVHPGNVISELLSPQEVERRRGLEGFIGPEDVAASVRLMASLPPSANVLELTVLPTKQPLVGRG